MEVIDAVVIGGGISGLTAGYVLKKKGRKVILLEKAGEAGGKIGTLHQDGFEIDLGPATFRINDAMRSLIQELDLQSALLYPDKKISRKRFIYNNGKLNPVGLNPVQLLGGSYLSWNSKRRIFRELSYKKSNEPADESIAQFIERHFGEEVLQKLVAPVLTGIYAGDARQLSVSAVLPILKELENKYGSVIKGFWNERKNMAGGREIAAMRGGLKVLLQKMTDAIGRNSVHYHADVTAIKSNNDHILVTATINGQTIEWAARQLIVTTPAHHAASLVAPYDATLANALGSIAYNKVWQIHCTLPSEAFPHKIGFGFLVAPGSNKTLLGAVHGGALFKDKAPQGKELFTLFCGGSQWQKSESPCEQAVKDFQDIMGLKVLPEVLHIQEWTNAIPQPAVEHQQVIDKIKSFEATHPNIKLTGNYRSGVALGDCIRACWELD
jgi:oxygen-dependent protoporphyrinogen oxidase